MSKLVLWVVWRENSDFCQDCYCNSRPLKRVWNSYGRKNLMFNLKNYFFTSTSKVLGGCSANNEIWCNVQQLYPTFNLMTMTNHTHRHYIYETYICRLWLVDSPLWPGAPLQCFLEARMSFQICQTGRQEDTFRYSTLFPLFSIFQLYVGRIIQENSLQFTQFLLNSF